MEYLLSIGIGILLGNWCKNIAVKKGKNTSAAFVWGFFFGIIAVIVYSCMEDKSGVIKTTQQIHPQQKQKKHVKQQSSSYFDSLHHKE